MTSITDINVVTTFKYTSNSISPARLIRLHKLNIEITPAGHKATSFIPAGTRHLSLVKALDRDSLMKLYFSLRMSYQDKLNKPNSCYSLYSPHLSLSFVSLPVLCLFPFVTCIQCLFTINFRVNRKQHNKSNITNTLQTQTTHVNHTAHWGHLHIQGLLLVKVTDIESFRIISSAIC